MGKTMDMQEVQERLRELRNIVNDKYIKAIDEAINAIDENMSYTDILWIMVKTYRELQEKFDIVNSTNKEL